MGGTCEFQNETLPSFRNATTFVSNQPRIIINLSVFAHSPRACNAYVRRRPTNRQENPRFPRARTTTQLSVAVAKPGKQRGNKGRNGCERCALLHANPLRSIVSSRYPKARNRKNTVYTSKTPFLTKSKYKYRSCSSAGKRKNAKNVFRRRTIYFSELLCGIGHSVLVTSRSNGVVEVTAHNLTQTKTEPLTLIATLRQALPAANSQGKFYGATLARNMIRVSYIKHVSNDRGRASPFVGVRTGLLCLATVVCWCVCVCLSVSWSAQFTVLESAAASVSGCKDLHKTDCNALVVRSSGRTCSKRV